ncbi:MAG: hypothetical protein ACREJ6_03445, partial [Candidatus Methylomirabilis sp.]
LRRQSNLPSISTDSIPGHPIVASLDSLQAKMDDWNCMIPQAVYAETVDRGKQAAYPDALAIREVLDPSMVRPLVRHPRAARLLEQRRGLGRGEQEALHLFFAVPADAIISDDAAFVTVLDQAGLRYLPPALVLVQLAHERSLDPREALEGLERMRPFIRPEVYQAARSDLEALRARRPKRAKEGESP